MLMLMIDIDIGGSAAYFGGYSNFSANTQQSYINIMEEN